MVEDQNIADLGESDSEEAVQLPASERKLVTQPVDLSVQTLFEQWREGVLILPTIQREYLWDNGRASRLIESILLNIPIPVMYFAETEEAKYEIFDGQQRIRSIANFLNDELSLSGISVLTEHRGKKYSELPERDQRFFRMRTLRIILISIDSHPSMKFEIYERLNSGSIALNAQELRNSIYRGSLNSLLHGLAADGTFRKLIGTKSPRKRMVDEELILRFFAMREGLNQYRPSLKAFLNRFMAQRKALSIADAAAMTTVFVNTVQTIDVSLGKSAFRVLGEAGEPLEPSVNRALFEAQMLAFSFVQHIPYPALVRPQVASLFDDAGFIDAISRATGDRSRTLTRLEHMIGALQAAQATTNVPFDLNA